MTKLSPKHNSIFLNLTNSLFCKNTAKFVMELIAANFWRASTKLLSVVLDTTAILRNRFCVMLASCLRCRLKTLNDRNKVNDSNLGRIIHISTIIWTRERTTCHATTISVAQVPLHLTLKMTTAKRIETSVTITNTNSPSHDYINLDDELPQTSNLWSDFRARCTDYIVINSNIWSPGS